jgi:hypothetical protein
MNRPLTFISLAAFTVGIVLCRTALADDWWEDGGDADLVVTYDTTIYDAVDDGNGNGGGGGGGGGGGCGDCNIGDRRCRDNSGDQICGADGNRCGVWYDNAACGENICVYSQCGDGDGPGTAPPPPAPTCQCSSDDDCVNNSLGYYCDGCNCQ